MDLTGLSNYVNENAHELINKSLMGSISMGELFVMPGIKSSETINLIGTQLNAVVGHCSVPSGDITAITQREMKVVEISTGEEICIADLNKFYTQAQLNKGSYDEELGFDSIYAEAKAEAIQKMVEKQIWAGSVANGAGNLALVDGFVQLFSAGIGQIAGNTIGATVIDATNIIDVVNATVAARHADSISTASKIFIGAELFELYTTALVNANLYHFNGESLNGRISVPGKNVTVIATDGLIGTNKLYLEVGDNFRVGTDLLSELGEDFKMWFSEDKQKFVFLAKYKLGVQVARPDYAVEFSL